MLNTQYINYCRASVSLESIQDMSYSTYSLEGYSLEDSHPLSKFFSKIWETFKNIFKAIFNFFFGGEDSSKSNEKGASLWSNLGGSKVYLAPKVKPKDFVNILGHNAVVESGGDLKKLLEIFAERLKMESKLAIFLQSVIKINELLCDEVIKGIETLIDKPDEGDEKIRKTLSEIFDELHNAAKAFTDRQFILPNGKIFFVEINKEEKTVQVKVINPPLTGNVPEEWKGDVKEGIEMIHDQHVKTLYALEKSTTEKLKTGLERLNKELKNLFEKVEKREDEDENFKKFKDLITILYRLVVSLNGNKVVLKGMQNYCDMANGFIRKFTDKEPKEEKKND